jgi:hypothetical protein
MTPYDPLPSFDGMGVEKPTVIQISFVSLMPLPSFFYIHPNILLV